MEIVDTSTLADKEWNGLLLPAPYSEVLGSPDPNATILVWGPKGSGKSTFAMGLASTFLPYAKARNGTVLYVSAEEGAGRTTGERAERLGVADEALLASDFRTYDDLFRAIEQHNARAVVLDSATVISSAQSKDAAHLMEALRQAGVAAIIVSHALKGANGYKGNSAIGHACYAEIKCYTEVDEDTGNVRHLATAEKNRYGPTVGNVVQIPMESDQILPLTDEAIGHSIRENFATGGRSNPREIDCTAPQSAQCKAIFAELSEEGRTIRARSEPNGSTGTSSGSENESGGGNQSDTSSTPISSDTAQSDGSDGAGSGAIDRLENALNRALK